MKAIDKIEAVEKKERLYVKAKGKCKHCGKRLSLFEAQLAHKLSQGYVDMFGAEIIHHEFNMDITCAKCNHLSLMSIAAHPVEASELIHRIKDDLRRSKNDEAQHDYRRE